MRNAMAGISGGSLAVFKKAGEAGASHAWRGRLIYPHGYLDQYTRRGISAETEMTHAIADSQKLLNRVRRLRGQVDAIERGLQAQAGCTEIMRLLTAARGAINGMMAEVVEDHIQMHMVEAGRKPSRDEKEAADELVAVLRSYIR
jgi:DNA-binding FrmR family transcriptional regulator